MRVIKNAMHLNLYIISDLRVYGEDTKQRPAFILKKKTVSAENEFLTNCTMHNASDFAISNI